MDSESNRWVRAVRPHRIHRVVLGFAAAFGADHFSR